MSAIRSMRAPQLCALLRSGELSLTHYYNDLEQHFILTEHTVQAFVPEDDRFARLQSEARHLEIKYPNVDNRPPLFGLPIGVKDIIHVDGFATQGGSNVPSSALKVSNGPEATVVKILREAGALILGKTTTTEFASLSNTIQTVNPHNYSRTPGGSSSGSAAAAGAGLCPLAIGTQTTGSINRPAAFCGVVGYKPSYARIPRDAVLAHAHSLDHVGLFATDLSGIQLMAPVVVSQWSSQLTPTPLKKTAAPVLGIPTGAYLDQADDQARSQFERDCGRLERAGFILKKIGMFPNYSDIALRHHTLMNAEFASEHAELYPPYSHLYHPHTADIILAGWDVSESVRQEIRNARLQMRAAVELTMDTESIDAWITPGACGLAPLKEMGTGDPGMQLPWTHVGLPTISIPTGIDAKTKLPFALQIVGRFAQDERLILDVASIDSVM